MTAAIIPRGPDDAGHEILGATALGFRRLSIVDLAGGHQPMSDAAGDVWVVMNGEIYNHADLRAELRSAGHEFRTKSDTEVLVHGWKAWGAALPEKLLGMFAFAILDRRSATLTLGRDRFGQKPLFWAETPEAFVFGSELRAVAAHPSVTGRVDMTALRRYLAYECVPVPHSMIEGVRKLAPGSTLTVRDGRVTSAARFHELTYSPKSTIGLDDAAAGLWSHLTRSVRAQLMADVPLGVFLSGGLDSTAITAAVREVSPGTPLRTFAIGMDDPSFDESGYAAEVADYFGTDHHVRKFTEAELLATVRDLPALLDEPLADASILPTYLLCRFARETVTVALSGDGGDELLAGYDPFAAMRWAGVYGSTVPRWAERAIISPLARALPVGTANMSLDFKVRQFLRGARLPFALRTPAWMSAFLPHELPEILTPDALGTGETFDSLYADVIRLDDGVRTEHPIDRQILGYSRWYLGEDILTKADRASMAVSLEVRAPFLDHELADWVNRLPADLKLRGGTRKRVLRRALEGRVPRTVLTRPKKGFGIPLTKWLRGPLRDWASSTLDGLERTLPGVVRVDHAKAMLEEHAAQRADHRKKLWALLCLAAWAEGRRSGRPRNGAATARGPAGAARR